MTIPTHIVAAGGIVEDGKGNVLLVKTYFHGWVFPGGQIEIGETIDEGVIREIKEESNIDASVCQLIGIYSNTCSYLYKDGVTIIPSKVMFDYICKYEGGKLGVSDETSDSRWVKKEEAKDLIDRQVIKDRYQAYLDYTGKINYTAYKTKPEYVISAKREL